MPSRSFLVTISPFSDRDAFYFGGPDQIDRQVLRPLRLEKLHGTPHLIQAVHAVLDRDPAVESDLRKQPEDGVVVDQTLSDFPVPQHSRIAGHAVRLLQIFQRRAGCEGAVGRVHRHNPMPHFLQEPDGIVAADPRVRRIVLDAKEGRVDLLDDLEKDVLRLRELRVTPQSVLVVVLHTEHDAAAFRVVERATDAVERSRNAFRARQPFVPLAAERAAMPSTKSDREVDRRLLALHLPLPLLRIGMREVRREADHGGDLAGLVHRARDRIDIRGRQAAEETVVVLDPFPAERRRLADPPVERHAAVGQLVEIALGEDADAWRHGERWTIGSRARRRGTVRGP